MSYAIYHTEEDAYFTGFDEDGIADWGAKGMAVTWSDKEDAHSQAMLLAGLVIAPTDWDDLLEAVAHSLGRET